jgi:hypothetical protein
MNKILFEHVSGNSFRLIKEYDDDDDDGSYQAGDHNPVSAEDEKEEDFEHMLQKNKYWAGLVMPRGSQSTDPTIRNKYVSEYFPKLIDCSNGGDGNGIRKDYWDWTDEDFSRLIKVMKSLLGVS